MFADRQIDRQMDRLTDEQIGNNMPRSFSTGGGGHNENTLKRYNCDHLKLD